MKRPTDLPDDELVTELCNVASREFTPEDDERCAALRAEVLRRLAERTEAQRVLDAAYGRLPPS